MRWWVEGVWEKKRKKRKSWLFFSLA